jgi:phage shock protein PspC (stress-responsive transcriptional regulator)
VRFLGPGKTVLSTSEVEQILRDVGPVDSEPAIATHAPHATRESPAGTAPKRLYQIREGAIVSGVCNGLSAYFNLDPTIIRVAFVVATVVETAVTDRPPWMTVGTYALLVFVVPYAKTSEQLAAAQGTSQTIPYKVQQTVEKLKAKLSTIGR